MPIDIVNSGTTDPVNGIITESDLVKMKNDFINDVDVKPLNERNQLIKKFSVSVMKEEIKELIAFYENGNGVDVITMNFAIHKDSFTACSGTDLSNSITVVMEAAKLENNNDAKQKLIPYCATGDVVVIPGYSSLDKSSFEQRSPCCPSANP